MAIEILGSYLGNKKVKLLHKESGAEISTSAPKDNNGDGSSFSPTDLAAASLGACMMTVMGIYAERAGIALEGSHFRVLKEMNAAPRRIGKLPVTFHLPQTLDSEQRKVLERVAATCPVHHSLHPEIESRIEFIYDV